MTHPIRSYTLFDQICLQAEQGLRVLHQVKTPGRPYPGDGHTEADLSPAQRKHIAGLLRVNHTGEVCAQALYFGQALLARTPVLRAHLHAAAMEEGDHLQWCETRLEELGGKTSLFNPGFYTLSVLIGMFAACLGDQISLGFVAATESQVEKHLQSHLDQLPDDDQRSKMILKRMQEDEIAHGSQALAAGGEVLSDRIQSLMRSVARVMTRCAYWG